MTDHRKEWAEGLREEIAEALWDHAWVRYEGDSAIRSHINDATDAVLAVVEPRVISLAGEVERLSSGLEQVGWLDIAGDLWPMEPEPDSRASDRPVFAAAALSPHPSERPEAST